MRTLRTEYLKLSGKIISLFFLTFFIAGCADEDPMTTLVPEMEEEMMEEEEVEICGEERYNLELFEESMVTTEKYGENLNFDGTETQELFMDIYEPIGDTLGEKRPVVIWAFGGSFVAGQREDMEPFARDLCKRGFVSASIDYRLLNFFATGIPDSLQAFDIAVKAMSDMKAAVRHLREDADTDNQFRIDPDNIYVGGLSAGAIVALTTALVQEDDIVQDHVREIIDLNGGIEGNSGDEDNLSYSSEVQGAISLSGAVYSLDWLDENDPPVVAIHGDNDQTVAYDYGFANIFGFDIIPLYGMGSVSEHAMSIGHDTELLTVPGGGHTDIYGSTGDFVSYNDEFFDVIVKEYLIREICQ